MKYEVRMSLSLGVIVDAKDEETAEKRATARIEKRLDMKDIYIAGGCDCHTVLPYDDDIEKKAEDAWAALTRNSIKYGD